MTMSKSHKTEPAYGSPNRTVRLLFSYEGDKVELVGQQHITMLAPPSDALEGYDNQAGFWIEMRDAGGQTLYRRCMSNPIQPSVEVFSNEGSHSIHREDVSEPKGAFFVLVPEMEKPTKLALCASAKTPGKPLQAAKEFAVFDVKGRS